MSTALRGALAVLRAQLSLLRSMCPMNALMHDTSAVVVRWRPPLLALRTHRV